MKALSDYTSARVQLGAAGGSLPAKPLLELRLAHARARDAVQFPLDTTSLSREMSERNWISRGLHSMARNRTEYLQRPDKGRQLDDASAAEVLRYKQPSPLTIVIADGLSALAVHRHTVPFLEQTFQCGLSAPTGPVWLVSQARVAIGDHVGELLKAELVIVIIGERPGLSTPDSLGVYLTWNPRRGRRDSERNCISNIHAQGLSYDCAAAKLVFLAKEAQRRQLTGVQLKDTQDQLLS